jgi:hypothetical protein
MEHLSSDIEQQQNQEQQQIQWRRDKIQELYSKGYSQRGYTPDIASRISYGK